MGPCDYLLANECFSVVWDRWDGALNGRGDQRDSVAQRERKKVNILRNISLIGLSLVPLDSSIYNGQYCFLKNYLKQTANVPLSMQSNALPLSYTPAPLQRLEAALWVLSIVAAATLW